MSTKPVELHDPELLVKSSAEDTQGEPSIETAQLNSKNFDQPATFQLKQELARGPSS